MKSITIHCHRGLKDHAKLFAKLGFASLETYDSNPHTLNVTYDHADKHKVKHILKKYSKHLTILKDGHHSLDGNIKSRLLINTDGQKFAHDDSLVGTDRAPPNYGNLPPVLANYYNFPTGQTGTVPNIAIISLGGTYLTNDLNTYWRTYLGQTGTPDINFVTGISGSTKAPNQAIISGDGSEENTLDIEIVMGICPRARITVYFGRNSLSGFYNSIARAISDGNKIISISWGAPENQYGGSNLNAFNQLFAYAANRGVAICAASGDYCATDGTSSLTVDFPAASPYVIACGGTTIGVSELTWSYNRTYGGWGTGGGISAYFKSLRNVAYPALKSTKPSRDSLIKSKNRSVPDLSLNADPLTGWTILFNGTLYVSAFGGTSCVSPAFSGFLGLINKNFGNRNPSNALYNAYGNNTSILAFKDIVAGTNNNLRGGVNVYNARAGFDQCTGMGSINGVNLANYLSNW